MFLSQTAEYAFRAMVRIALQDGGEPIRAKDLAEAAEIPPHYLSKVMRRLVVAGLVTSRRGHGGGFVLALRPEEITYCQILDAVAAAPSSGHCAFGWGTCDSGRPCPLHSSWSEMQDALRQWSLRRTLADVDPLIER